MRWSDLIGLRIGQNHQYQLIEEIGRGGAARVYRALDHEQGRHVAIKMLPIETEDRQSFMQRFRREAEVIRTLHHPNIVQVYDADETDEFVYLVLRLLEGGALRKRIASERLSPQEVCQYMIQIALALSHAHRQGIIHRDVKPSNMLLDNDEPGHILLSDFGTAKILNAVGLTKTGTAIGTPEYMSPEQAEGREVDQRSDVYSLGCSLYEALAGRPPFMGNTGLAVLFQQVHSQATNIRAYNYEVPPQLWSVLRRCLAKRPDERYGTAERLAEALEPFAEGLIQPTQPPWRSAQTRRLTADALSDMPSMPSRPMRETNRPLSAAPPLTPPPLEGLSANGGPEANGHGLTPDLAPGAGPIPLYLEGERAPNSRPTLGPRGPKPTVRLPVSSERRTGLLSTSGPMRADERQAVADFAAQLDAEEFGSRGAPSGPGAGPAGSRQTQRPAPPADPLADAFPTMPTPITPLSTPRALNSQPYQGATSGPLQARTNGPQRASTSVPLGGQASRQAPGRSWDDWGEPSENAVYRAPNSGFRAPPSGPPRSPQRVTSIPLDQDTIRAGVNPKTLGRRARRRPPALVGAAAALALLLVVGVALGMGGIRLFAKQGAPGQPTPRPSATLARATATATTTQPTVTTTPDAQTLLNQQAASAFRAITLAPFTDGACSSANMTTRFSGGPVFVNLCMAKGSAPGPITVQVRQNGAVIRTLIANLRASSSASYSQGHTLPAGAYDMYVTMQISGKQAVADDIAFTVS